MSTKSIAKARLSEGDESVLLEVTTSGEVVWRLKLKDTPAANSPGWFYKAQRICNP